jgi:hypothetical protein
LTEKAPSKDSGPQLKERGAITGARLKEGEEKRFEQVGIQVGTALAARGR